ncbi:NlpC/P60 family protein [Streptomyces sp. NBC_00053]|uniref:C40 family peptidase n=1 Tax=unclassified Streptomyces TaxID=2593676 RepID=UPI0022583E33|nr:MULTISPECIES: C40 family peptidase [unclassified Streptomyces]MCX4394528.1 NlpC/P60 family protein [Streptomyces sp. NBC_01767]MCX5502625.1 NlpC/P60 family protein [Streptomyces sp. NBC_00052]MCX5548839.1 NlpC/P60 family protein [Streptomyces sp. NBC_00051]WSC28218.1 NlpC/P60 family protein [Streptomyces sp. NBC_01768]WSP47115.1 NlpC/P60 family protein [Streptomyces sp. NBC_01243]
MPALASHRKPRPRVRTTAPAVGLTTAALASVTLLSTQSAVAAPGPKPRVEDVQKKVDDLYRQAGTATQQYNQAKEASATQRAKVDALLDDVAERADKLNDARRTLGTYAAAQYRNGSIAPSATFFLADDPQSYFDQSQLMDRMTSRQQKAITDFRTQQAKAAKKRSEAVRSLETLTTTQATLRTSKQDVQKKLGEARTLLSKLTAEEKARLAEIERKKEAEAKRKAEELAKQQAEADREAEEAAKEPGGGSGTGTGSGTGSDSDATTKAAKVLAFARAQIGKPYVWGATGPASYDCSGLTQAAWKAAGVDIPRTTWDQVKIGTRVATADLRPGDLVFFYDDISHVGIYKGDGMMIHAPKPGANVREESIYYMPIYGSVRPA